MENVMAAMEQPVCDFGWKAPPFSLADPDGRIHTLDSARGPKGVLVMFICNHCPYVRAVVDRLVRDAQALQQIGIGVIAVMPNDYDNYPDDAPPKMKQFAAEHGFTFPYVIDETQQVARAYDAVCTPDFFGFNADLELQYRGRLDASRRDPAPPGAPRELYEAMRQVAETGAGPKKQSPSMGCSIKWKST
jgi:peroxiredoxin